MLTLDNIYTAANLLNEAIRRTDIVAAPRLCPGVDLYLKTENLQTTGSFTQQPIPNTAGNALCLNTTATKTGNMFTK